MGNIINPIGGRLGFMTFWRVTWPVFFNKEYQFSFFQLSVHLRVLFNVFFQKVFSFNPKHSSASVLHGMLVKLIINLGGFKNQNLTVFLKFFDYKITVNALTIFNRRSFANMVVFRVKKLLRIKTWLKGNPLIKRFNQNNFAWAFSKLKRYVNRSFVHRRKVKSMLSYLKFYIKRGMLVYFSMLHKRLMRWHFNLIFFTKPYIFYICKIFKLRSCFIYTRISKSSISAALVVKYMVLKLNQGFGLSFVLNSVRRALKLFLHNVSGYKLCLSGRFTRKQIATYRWVKFGDLSLNQQASAIDYAQNCGISKFGMFGIKFWVFRHPIINLKS